MMASAYQHCLSRLQENAPSLYSALLFLPEKARGPAAALYAFHDEIERIAFMVSEPMPGEIRLQWWRDVFAGERKGEAGANPLASALLETIQSHQLPMDGFARYIDARVFDLYNDPMPDRQTLEAYFGETESFMHQMVANCYGIENGELLANACGHGGVATGLSKVLLRLPHDRNHQRVFIPADLLAECGLDSKTWLSEWSERHTNVVAALALYLDQHIVEARTAINSLPKTARPVFGPIAIAKTVQSRAARTDHPEQRIELQPLRTQIALWKYMLFGI